MEFQYTNDTETNLQARKWHWKKYGSLQYWWIVFGVVLFVLGMILSQFNPPLGIGFLFYGIYCVLRKQILKRYFLRQIKSSPDHGKTMKVIISDESILQITGESKSEISWSSIYQTVTTPEGFLVYLTKQFYFWIPWSGSVKEIQKEEIDEIFRSKSENTILA